MNKFTLMLIVVVVALSDGVSHARSTTGRYGISTRSFHKYYSGIVQRVFDSGIVLNSNNYFYASKVKILSHVKNNGVFKEAGASMYEVREGVPVIIKVEGTTIHEIIIERWKQ